MLLTFAARVNRVLNAKVFHAVSNAAAGSLISLVFHAAPGSGFKRRS